MSIAKIVEAWIAVEGGMRRCWRLAIQDHLIR